MSEHTMRWGPPPPEDGITVEELRPHGWAPGKYLCRACSKCGEQFGDADKRSRKCRPCAVASFKAVQAVRGEARPLAETVDPIAVAVAAEREACAALVEPKGPRPCDCDRCTCMNSGDVRDVTDWDTSAALAAAIRARSA